MKIDSIEFFREVLDDGDMELARLSLQERPELARGRSQFSPIVIASEKFNIDLVRLLLKCGADVNQTSYRDETALHVAAVNGLPDIARVLINAGANVEAKNDIGHTPLMWSTWGGDIAERIEVKELLLEMGAYYDLNSAVCLGDEQKVRTLLRNSSSAISDAPLSDHLLISAVWADSLTILKLLLSHGANPNSSPNGRHTPLSATSSANSPAEFRAELIKAGADPEFKYD